MLKIGWQALLWFFFCVGCRKRNSNGSYEEKCRMFGIGAYHEFDSGNKF
jgi:hypothetical protein